MKIVPAPACVRPRVVVSDGDGPVLLEDEVRARLERGQAGLVVIGGPPGAGKSTALAHLAHTFGGSRLLVADGPGARASARLVRTAQRRLVVCATPTLGPVPGEFELWKLSPWTRDEWIEYLLAAHRDRCASVVRRLEFGDRSIVADGLPLACRPVLDRLAANESLADARAAMDRELLERLPEAGTRAVASRWCLELLLGRLEALGSVGAQFDRQVRDRQTRLLLACGPIKLQLAAEYLVERLQAADGSMLERCLPQPLVAEVGRTIVDDRAVLVRLRSAATGRQRERHAVAASLLHAAGEVALPRRARKLFLKGAYLAGVKWPGVQLTDVHLEDADLSAADLIEARLVRVRMDGARLAQADLRGAQLRTFFAPGAVLSGANLSNVRAAGADFSYADLHEVRLDAALLRGACLYGCDLRGAVCHRTDFGGANLRHAQLDDADFQRADFTGADLRRLALRTADFQYANFTEAKLQKSDLEDMRLPAANFERAILRGAHLTGSQMPQGCFYQADLRQTGLADIAWEGADLREADLRECSFHLGSSRSGLVGSPIACEGSRTGFYTDEYFEQDFKCPEEIRKANLCGADLRGARIEGVDFYLVDLRGARYTADQAQHFRRCQAILETRV